ncbi:MAG: DNA repair protein RecO [Acidimicrobiales bacterium]
MALYRDEGIVLRTHKLGEADRIICILTRNHGKVRAVAKGVRKTKSRFGARMEPPTHLQLQLYEGRGELQIVDQAETIDHFGAIRTDLDRLTRAVSMLEAADQLGLEGEPNPALYQMLLGALRALAGHSGPLVLPAFFLKVLALEGFRPVVDRCVECGASEPLVSFDLESGGARCSLHRTGPAISPGALTLLNDILGGRLGSALNVGSSASTLEVDHLATRAMEHHLERRLRSVAILDHR